MTSLPHHSPGHSPAVSGPVIDWSAVETQNDISQNIQTLVSWVGSFPRTSGIRVYLPTVAHRASMRRLQCRLQTLGCTVTCRMRHPA